MPIPAPAIPHVQEARILIDGVADDAAWGQAALIDGFLTFNPVPGQAPVGETRVRLLSDDAALYLLFEVQDPEPDRIRATLGRRDSRFDDDFVGMYLDPGAEGQRAYVFIVNPLGLQMDGIALGDGDEDFSWDTWWDSRGSRTDEGYLVEIAIPWRSIRHDREVDETGILLFRQRGVDAEKSSWPPLDLDVQGMLVQMAHMGGPGPLPRAAGLDLTPSLTFGWTDQGPTADRWSFQGLSPGLTLQAAPTPSDSVVIALNPDFSQVESDGAQIDVNRRYALYYEEKRPFFLEGQEWFQTPFEDLVYTRSMAAPRLGVRATTSHGGWTAAALGALDARPSPSVSEGGGWTEADLEGLMAAEAIGRFRRSIGADGYLGLILSERAMLGSDLANTVGGVDSRVRLSDHLVAQGAALASHTRFADGSDHAAPAGAATLRYETTHFWVDSEAEAVAADFRAENGFVTHADRVGNWLESGYSLFPDGKIIRSVTFIPMDLYSYWHLDGRMRELVFEPDISWRWGNGVFTFVEYQYLGELYADQWFTFQRGEGGLGGQFTRWLGLYAFAGGGEGILYDETDPRLGIRNWVELSPSFQPASWLSLSTSLSWERFNELDGTKVYGGWTGRVSLETFATRSLWARFIVDHSTFSELSRAEALLAWERAPGRAIYVGGSSDLAETPTWQIFAKASWTLRI